MPDRGVFDVMPLALITTQASGGLGALVGAPLTETTQCSTPSSSRTSPASRP